MKLSIYKSFLPVTILDLAVSVFVSCNKDLPVAEPITIPAPTGATILEYLADPNYRILNAAVTKAGTNFTNLLSDKSAVFTFFAPDDAAFQRSGVLSIAHLAGFRPGQLDTLLRYHLIGGQMLTSANISSNFPNLQEPTMLALAPPSASLPPGLRMSIFPSKRGSNLFVNNIPITQADIAVANGVVHRVAALVAPPSQFLWNRIDTDPDLTYLKAAIIRADSGAAASSSLQAALQNPAANLTIFAPNNLAFQQILTGQITLALMAQGLPQANAAAAAASLADSSDVFSNPALFSVLTATTVKGIVVYHILGARAFSVNIPTTATSVPTLLNSAIPSHPGVSVQAVFGATGVTAATVKGAANPSASNVLINPTPANKGTSDQHYINGVIHIIDQVLRPQ
jgi:uncharacterized surface protein with fasciclin (FAS1) repeats